MRSNARLARVLILVALVAPPSALSAAPIPADHPCDPVDDPGWNLVPSNETISEMDSPPFQEGAPGNWFVNHVTKYLPFCNYYNEIGNYSLRSYSLAPRTREERITICRATPQGGSAAVAPYTGPCPPH